MKTVDMTEAQLQEFAREHVYYERLMLDGAVAQLIGGVGRFEGIAQNALLEAVMLHARNLDDFLRGWRVNPPEGVKTVRSADVIATDYAPNWIPTPALSKPDRELADKKVAHLTTWRMTKEPVASQRVRADVAGHFAAFLAVLDPPKRAWFGPDAP